VVYVEFRKGALYALGERGKQLKGLLAVGALIPLLTFPISSYACSSPSCLNKGAELRPDFVVTVTHRDKPLQGVNVRVSSAADGNVNKLFSGVTAADGTVRVVDLPPGEYWLNADLLGIVAGTECFHVNPRPTRKAKKKVSYEWGDLAPATRQVAGRLIDSQPGQGGTPIWNQLHRVDTPISEARLKLQNPFSGGVYSTLSDSEGHFSFGSIPNGIYVLHIEGGTAPRGRSFESSDHLIRLSDTDAAKADTLLLSHRDAGAGSCGGTYLELQKTPK
jgi:hypothetical protein